MLRLIWNLSVGLRNALHRFAPTNILSDAIRTRRRGLKWGVPAMLLAGPYLYLAYICTVLIDEGGPAWLSLLVLLFIWNAMKMLWIGPVSLVVLIRVSRCGGESASNPPAQRAGGPKGDQSHANHATHDVQRGSLNSRKARKSRPIGVFGRLGVRGS